MDYLLLLLLLLALGLIACFVLLGRVSADTRRRLLWLLCGLCLLFAALSGYWIMGLPGTVVMMADALVLSLAGLYLLAGRMLPLRDSDQRQSAFSSLLAFTLGATSHYYLLEERDTNKKEAHRTVEGNPFNDLAGPGIILTGCDHVAVVSNGAKANRVEPPGLSFTGLFETLVKVVDLRPQQRAFTVEAITRDGFLVEVRTFVPFKVKDNGQQIALGKPFPFDKDADFRAVYGQLVEHIEEKKDDRSPSTEKLEEISWDRLVSVVGTRIVQDIISRYTVDELCAADDPSREPRIEIGQELRARIKKDLEPWSITVIGGGISNLMPKDRRVIEQRLRNWQAGWQRKAALARSRGEATRSRLLGRASVRAKVEMLRIIAEGYAQAVATGEQDCCDMMSLSLVETIKSMVDKQRETGGERGVTLPSGR